MDWASRRPNPHFRAETDLKRTFPPEDGPLRLRSRIRFGVLLFLFILCRFAPDSLASSKPGLVVGIQGGGRGHIERMKPVVKSLARDYRLMIVGSRKVTDSLRQHVADAQMVPGPYLEYSRNLDGSQSDLRTLVSNSPFILGSLLKGPKQKRLLRAIEAFDAQAVVCDSELRTACASHQLKLPRVNVDRLAALVFGQSTLPSQGDLSAKLRRKQLTTRAGYQAFFGGADRTVTTFFGPTEFRHKYLGTPVEDRVTFIGPILRSVVLEVAKEEHPRGDHLLAYFSRRSDFTKEVAGALCGTNLPVRIYGIAARKSFREENLTFCTPSPRDFVVDLRTASAAVATTGNNLIGEALYFGVPVLGLPRTTFEQQYNAAQIEAMGFGERIDSSQLTADEVRRFLDRSDGYRQRALKWWRDDAGQWIDSTAQLTDHVASNIRDLIGQ